MDHGYRYAVAILPASYVIDLAAIGEILGNGDRMELATEYEIGQRCPDCRWGYYLRLVRCTVWKL